MQQLTPLDGTFLELEEADPSAHMHIGGVMVFGPLPDGSVPPIEDIRGHLDERLCALPRYRHRLSKPTMGDLRRPYWEPDPTFDVARHVRRATLPSPGGWEELLEWAGDYYSQRLDRTAPLWDIVLLEGLADGHWALATKTHHCLVDGMGSVDVAHLLLDVEPEPPERTFAAPANGDGWHPRRGADLARGVRAGVDAALHPRNTVKRALALGELLLREELMAAPHSSLNDPIGGRRRLRGAQFSVAEIKEIRRALGGTLNDVVLASVAGGLRALLLHRDEDPPAAGLRAMVPVNVRTEDEKGALGNRVISLFVNLPVAEPEPLARYARIQSETAARKRSGQALGADTLLQVADLTPPVVHAVLSRSLFATRLFNVTVTNVRGPNVPLYAFGAPMKTVYPLVPLAASHAVGIAVVSYNGKLDVGINADYDSVPDLDVLAEGIVASYRWLLDHAKAAAAA